MPITKYTGANIKKMKKDDLIHHIIDLYKFIDLFDNSDLINKLQEENETLKADMEQLQREHDEWEEEALDMREELAVIRNKLGNICFDCDYDWEKHIIDKLKDKIDLYPLELKKENEKLQEENEKLKTLITTIKSTIDDGIPK
tara:strand:+ start:1121 stop:1549 length:429 start_codon:yes stop_codon:yes gene_type:complete